MIASRWLGPEARWLLPAVGFVLVSASCGVRPAPANAARRPGSTALISGMVEASPGCPVERQNPACRPGLLDDVQVEARPLATGPTATTRARVDGHYAFRLRPGPVCTGRRDKAGHSRAVVTYSSRSRHRRPSVSTSIAIAASADAGRPASTAMVRSGSLRLYTHRLGQ